jgi:hypothetical protein
MHHTTMYIDRTEESQLLFEVFLLRKLLVQVLNGKEFVDVYLNNMHI